MKPIGMFAIADSVRGWKEEEVMQDQLQQGMVVGHKHARKKNQKI